MSSTSKNTKLQIIAVTIFLAVAAVPMYYPISLHMSNEITDRWDGLAQAWMPAWYVHHFASGISGIFNGNIFWPHHDALAYSDHRLGQSMIAAPFYIITGNPVFAQNAMVMLSFVIGGLGMFLLVRRLTGSGSAALVAAVVYAYCPWRMQHAVTLNMVANQWLPFALLFLHRSLDNGRLRDGALTGLFFALHSLSSFYHAAMGAVAVMTVVIAWLVMSRFRISRRVWASLVAGALVSGLIVGPTIWPYYHVSKSQGMVRNLDEIENLSADPLDYLRAPAWNRLWGGITAPLENQYSPSPGENNLFTGLTVLVLALIGLLRIKRREWAAGQKIYLWVAVIAFIFSLGPYLHLAWRRLPVPLPYLAAYYLLPGFKGIRAVARFGVIVELGMAVLAAYGFIEILKNRKSKGGRAAWTAGVVALLFIEFFSSPLPSFKIQVDGHIPDVYKWLAKKQGDFAIVEVPQLFSFEGLPRGEDTPEDPLGFRYTYYAAYHWKETVNGRSAFIPETTVHVLKELNGDPDGKSVNLLRYLGVKYLVLHSDAYYWEKKGERAKLVEEWASRLPVAQRFGPDVVYEVPDPAGGQVRNNLTGLEAEEFYGPEEISPGARFNVEVKLAAGNEFPVYSFELMDMEASAEVEGQGAHYSFTRSHKNFLMIDAGDAQAEVFTFEAPNSPGEYEWTISLKTRGRAPFDRTFHFRQKVGDYPDSSKPGVLKDELVMVDMPKSVEANGTFEIRAIVKNTGDTLWRAYRFDDQSDDRGVVSLGIRSWYDPEGRKMKLENTPFHYRGLPGRSIPPGGTATVTIRSFAPAVPGRYRIVLDMVDELVVWFQDSGNDVLEEEIEVTPPRPPEPPE